MTHCDAVRERGQEQRGGTQQLDREPRLPKGGTISPQAEQSLPGTGWKGLGVAESTLCGAGPVPVSIQVASWTVLVRGLQMCCENPRAAYSPIQLRGIN